MTATLARPTSLHSPSLHSPSPDPTIFRPTPGLRPESGDLAASVHRAGAMTGSEVARSAALANPRLADCRSREAALRRPRRAGAIAPRRIAGTACAGGAHDRRLSAAQRRVIARRRAVAAILVGVGLAGLVWVLTLFGNSYAASVAPAPVSTEVVHVRAGESLSAVADRIAPEVPTDVVVSALVDLNDLESSNLVAGQPLLAPEYR